MGGIGKTIGNIGKSLGGVLKTALPIAASFIPGPWGKAAGMLGGMMQGSQQQGQANGYYQQAGENASNIANIQNKYYEPLLQNMMKQAGIGPDGKPDPNAMPFGASDAAASRYNDNAGTMTAQTVASMQHAQGGKGFNGASSVNPALLAQIMRGNQSGVAANNRQTGIDASNAQWARTQGVMNALQPGNPSALLAAGAPYQQQANATSAANAQDAANSGGAIGQIGSSIWNKIFGHKGFGGIGGYNLQPTNTPGNQAGDTGGASTGDGWLNTPMLNNPAWQNPALQA